MRIQGARQDTLRAEVEVHQERLRLITQNAPIVLWSTDRAGKVNPSEGRGLEVLGNAPGGDDGRRISELYPDPREAGSQIRRALSGKEFEADLREGEVGFHCKYFPLYDAKSQLNGMACVSIIITDRKRVEGERVDSMPAISILEILNPLEPQIHKQARMIDQLLDLSRIRAGGLHLNLESFDLCEMTQETTNRLREHANSSGSTPDDRGLRPSNCFHGPAPHRSGHRDRPRSR